MEIVTGIYLTLWALGLSAVLYSSNTLFAPTNKSATTIVKIVSSKLLGLNVLDGSIGGIVLIFMTLSTVGWLILKTFTAMRELTGSYRTN